MNKLPYHDARMVRLKGRRAALDNESRVSPYRVHRLQAWKAWDAEWCRGYDEAAKAPDAPWFDADGNPYRCGAPRQGRGGPCQALVDKRGDKCHAHRERPPPHPGPAAQPLLPLPAPRPDAAWQRWTDGHRKDIEAKRAAGCSRATP